MISEAYHGDCMDLMAQFPDKFFDLAKYNKMKLQ